VDKVGGVHGNPRFGQRIRSEVAASRVTRVLLSVADDGNDHNLLQKGTLL
jgi:hypothetical protein